MAKLNDKLAVMELYSFINADQYHSDTTFILLSHDKPQKLNRIREEDICIYVSDVPIIRSVIGIGHYF